jgi:purine nucleosidase
MNVSGLPVRPRCRVIIDNDWSGDPDGLLALAHHLLSPSNHIVAVTSSFLSPQFGSPLSRAADGARLAARLVDEVAITDRPRTAAGCESPFASAGSDGEVPDAVDAIIAEANRTDGLPLYLVCGGPLTNVAAAIRQDPSITRKLTLIWVGGAVDPATPEYNRDTDPTAAEFVLGRWDLEVCQFPVETYRQCAVSVAELQHGLCSSGVLGRWLWERFISLHLPDVVQLSEVWPIGDSPPVLLTALTTESSCSEVRRDEATQTSRRVFTQVDHRLIWGDLLAKLRLHEQLSRGSAASS